MRLTGNRYNEIEQTVLKLFMNIIIKGFPLDCFEICKQLNITLIPYSKLSDKQITAVNKVSNDGFSVLYEMSEGEYKQCIYYNDRMPMRRIRFTIMHELGHIYLGHTEHSDLAESEANYFAKYALAPPPLVYQLHIEDYLELSEVFDISKECAFYSMRAYLNWLKYGTQELLNHEITLISLFQSVI
jgi:Zn-dependent peptidase ImmA (M78 family)